MVRVVFDGLHAIDWASMEHAYGSAEEVPGLLWALRSPDTEERRTALDRFYSAVHHQLGITPRELTVLNVLAEGLTAAAIARRLGISMRTVHAHLNGLYRKLETHDRLSTVLLAEDLGLTLPPTQGAHPRSP